MRVLVIVFVAFCSIFVVNSTENHKENNHHQLKEKFHHKEEHVSSRHHAPHYETKHHSELNTHHEGKSHHSELNHHHLGVKHHHSEVKSHPHQEGKSHHSELNHHHLGVKHHHTEHNRAKYHDEPKNHLGNNFFHHSYRDNNCHWVCSEDPTPHQEKNSTTSELGLIVYYNSSSSLIVLKNTSLKLLFIINYSSNTFILINGQTGVAIVIDIKSQQVIRLKENAQTGILWNPSNTEELLKNFSTEAFLKLAEQYGEKSSLTNIPETVSKEIEDYLEKLGIPIPFKTFLQFVSTNGARFGSLFQQIYKGSGSFPINNSFKWFLRINFFLSKLLDPATTGIDLSNVKIDPAAIFQGKSSIETIIKLFSQIGKNVDLSKVAQKWFSSRDGALKFFGEVTGGSHNGLDGLINILVNIGKTTSGQGSIDQVISSILKFNGTDLNEPTYSELINQGLDIAKSQNQLFNSTAFDGVYKFLKALGNDNAYLSNVNVGDVMKIFLSPNPSDKVSTVIKVLSTFAPQRGIPQFFKFIRDALNGTQNPEVLSGLIPGLNVSQYIGNGSVWQNVIQGNWSQFLSEHNNLSSALSQIPVFGQIASEISSHWGNLEQYLNPGFFQSLFNGTSGFGGIMSGFQNGFQNGFQSVLNSTQTGGLGGLVSGIQNVGHIFGLDGGLNLNSSIGANESVTAQSAIEPTTEKSNSSTVDVTAGASDNQSAEASGNGAAGASGNISLGGSGTESAGASPEQSAGDSGNISVGGSGTESETASLDQPAVASGVSLGASGSETADTSGNLEESGSSEGQLGVRGYLAGSFGGGLIFRNKHGAERKHGFHGAHQEKSKKRV